MLFVCRLESVMFLCTVHIYDAPSGKCSVSVHSTHFWCTVWKVFCFCAQYTFMMHRLESVLFLCTVHIYDAQCYIYLSNRLLFKLKKVLCCLHCFVTIWPWWRQFQSLSKHVPAVRFLMNVTNTKHTASIPLRMRYDVVS